MADTTFEDINSLGDNSFIGGTYYEMIFYVQDENGAVANLSGATVSCKFSPYGQPTQVELVKAGTVTSTSDGIFKIILNAADTLTWQGKYVFQAHIVTLSGREYIPAQGIITIIQIIK
jgi:hypothetical protein